MIVCALAGFLSARFFVSSSSRERLLLAIAIGMSDRPVRELPPAERATGGGLWHVLPDGVPDGAKRADASARPCLRHRLPRSGSRRHWSANCDQCRKPIHDYLWRRRRGAARHRHRPRWIRIWSTSNSSCCCAAIVWTAADHVAVARCAASGAGGGGESCREHRLFCRPIRCSRHTTPSRSPCFRCGHCCLLPSRCRSLPRITRRWRNRPKPDCGISIPWTGLIRWRFDDDGSGSAHRRAGAVLQ